MILANILQPLIDLFEKVLVWLHSSTGASWGLSIILLTILVRALLVPLALKQVRSMRELQRHAPELKKLQEKYKDDPQRRNQETMRFYQENQVNPFASCLPLLAQLPVFLSLFYMLRSDLRHDICPSINPAASAANKACGLSEKASEVAAAQFWFIPDITDKATGGVLVTLIALYVGSQLLSSLLMMTPTVDRTQRIIMLALPVVFVPFILYFPAGLLVYWITTNVWTIVQQQVLKRIVARNEPDLPTPAAASSGAGAGAVAAGNGKRGSGGLFNRLAQMAEEQQQRQEDVKAGSKRGGPGGGESGKSGARVTKAPPPPPRSRKRKRSGRRK